MAVFERLALAAAVCCAVIGSGLAAETKDIKEFVKQAFEEQIEAVKAGIYCRALSCEFEVETFFATETDPKTYALSTTGWLEGTIQQRLGRIAHRIRVQAHSNSRHRRAHAGSLQKGR